MRDRVVRIPETLSQLPKKEVERILDFHARLPMTLIEKLEKASKEKGVLRNDIVKMALEAFLK